MEGPFQKRGGAFPGSRIDDKARTKDSVTSHPTGLTERLLKFFAPRPPLEFWEPTSVRPTAVVGSGLAPYVAEFEASEVDLARQEEPQRPRLFRGPELQYQTRIDEETQPERAIRVAEEAREKTAAANEAAAAARDTAEDPHIEGDPFKTLFVGRLAYETTERKLRREFEEFGPIARIRIVHDRSTEKPRGYAFIEYETKNDMKQAYKKADGRKIDGRRVLVDVERGRTVPGWLPRYMGGGKGGESRAAKAPKDPNRILVRRQIERFLAERSKGPGDEQEPDALASAHDMTTAEDGAQPDRVGEGERTRPARSRSRDADVRSREGRSRSRSRSRSGDRGRRPPSRERHGERDEFERVQRSRSPRGAVMRKGPPGLGSEDDDSEREAGELPDRADDGAERDYGSNGRGSQHESSRYGERKRDRDDGYDRYSKRVRERDPVEA